ncbi:beta-propeller fold lactonase family protein [Alloacidobacterium dinghuense]|uniref:Beta-propeller fold lactonase family protein n=1 Tax=Alloacidobacterium dinghuense TaxID=2763107 RepID=A0A7G8BL44_9BACT|nr:beta-propeller fold lactonase family protein [Alloacidobacterium dinghuense]QNI33264.1 beta-propeller fold lactonase family protein [Alloacidobacterium dinghuense]
MKLRKSGRTLLATATILGLGLGLTSCSPSNTVDFVYVTASKNNPGQISVYKVDSESGALTQIQDSPYPSGGRNPVGTITSPDGKYLYVINKDDNSIVEFAIGTDGKIYQQQTCNTPGSEPVALTMNASETLLYVVDFFSPTTPGGPVYSSANPGPGALIVYPVDKTTGNIGGSGCAPVQQTFVDANNVTQTATYVPIGFQPTGVNALANGNSVFVAAQDGLPSATSTLGVVDAFDVNSSGTLSPVTTYPTGTAPSSIASDPTNRFLYVTDSRQNQLITYTILSTGILNASQNPPVKTDTFPVAITVDPRGFYIYVANYNASDINAYAINQSTGTPSAVAGASAYATGAGPSCVLVEPGLGRFIYTANFIDNTVTGMELNPNTGALTANQNSPYLSAGQPTCAAAIPHGNHSTQAVSATAGS